MSFGVETIVFFLLLSLLASTVNGGLGYGYSSISTPLALLVLINRIVNPAYVLLEALLNTVMLGLSGKQNVKATFRRALPLILALVPGVIVGSLILNIVAPLWVKLTVYAVILPFILLQIAGFRRPLRSESRAGVPLGIGIGLLYSITTISGPPIALFWNNQGLRREEFKAAVAQVRIAESCLTAVSYYFLGLFTVTSLSLFSIVAPPVLVGIPLGIYIVKKVQVETFRRVCMSFDAVVVGFGLANTVIGLFGVPAYAAYAAWFLVVALSLLLLYRYFKIDAPGIVTRVEKELKVQLFDGLKRLLARSLTARVPQLGVH